MTVLRLGRASLLLMAAALSSSCGVAGGLDAATERDLAGARASAKEALARVERLEDRLTEVEAVLRSARSERAAVERLVRRRAERLGAAVTRLRSSLEELRAKGSAVAEDAARALATATAAARDISVLTRRFDYHLRSHDRS